MKRIGFVVGFMLLAGTAYAQLGNSILFPLPRASSCQPGMEAIQFGGNVDPNDDVAGGCYVYEYIGPGLFGVYVYSAQNGQFLILNPDMTQTTYYAELWNQLTTPTGCSDYGQMVADADWDQGYIDQQNVSHDASLNVDVRCGGATCNYAQSIYWYGSKFGPDDPFGYGFPVC